MSDSFIIALSTALAVLTVFLILVPGKTFNRWLSMLTVIALGVASIVSPIFKGGLTQYAQSNQLDPIPLLLAALFAAIWVSGLFGMVVYRGWLKK